MVKKIIAIVVLLAVAVTLANVAEAKGKRSGKSYHGYKASFDQIYSVPAQKKRRSTQWESL